MYNESYDEYIRNIIGYPDYNKYYDNYSYRQDNRNTQLENSYPEIYKIIYPMITKACRNIRTPISQETLENLTDEIYRAVESDNEINVNINLGNEVQTNISKNTNTNNKKEIETKKVENRGEDRQFRNKNIRDLIQILLIRELLGRPNINNQMPPPNRPPFPGGIGPVRPPIRPRMFENEYNNIYEY